MEHFLTHPVASHGYVAVFLLMAISSACIPIPSEIVMLFGGALASATFAAAQHPPVAKLSFVAISLVGVAGSLVGSWAAYALGGRPLVERWGRYLLIRPHEVDRAEAWFDRHGEAAVLWTRLVPLARAFISLPAGVARMPFWRFSAYTFLGVLPWCFGLAGAGYALGGSWHTIVHWFLPVSIVVAVFLVGWLVLWFRRRIRARRELVPS